VRSLLGKRFLVAHAPRLPLLECPWADDCDCQFTHHDDRRAESRAQHRAAAGAPNRRISDIPPDV
jgi:hypothetical protein